ncbi:hypothetical protein OG352_02725 [Streptomyces sp. NBC_01485]|nr:hypothetical protein [Streptomyces sp. NBC_01485]
MSVADVQGLVPPCHRRLRGLSHASAIRGHRAVVDKRRVPT